MEQIEVGLRIGNSSSQGEKSADQHGGRAGGGGEPLAIAKGADWLLAPGRVEVENPAPLAGSCCSLDAARRSSGFAAGNAAAASSVSSVLKEPQHLGAYHRP